MTSITLNYQCIQAGENTPQSPFVKPEKNNNDVFISEKKDANTRLFTGFVGGWLGGLTGFASTFAAGMISGCFGNCGAETAVAGMLGGVVGCMAGGLSGIIGAPYLLANKTFNKYVKPVATTLGAISGGVLGYYFGAQTPVTAVMGSAAAGAVSYALADALFRQEK